MALTLTVPALWATACGTEDADTPDVADIGDAAAIDLRVVIPGPDAAQDLYRLEDRAQHAGTIAADGVIAVITAPITLAAADRTIDTCALSVNVPTARRFHPDPGATGLTGVVGPATGELLVDAFHADALDLSPDDRVTLSPSDGGAGGGVELTVAAVVPDVSIAGYCGALVSRDDMPPTTDGHLLVSLDDPDDVAARERTRGALEGLAADIGRPELRATDAETAAGQDAGR